MSPPPKLTCLTGLRLLPDIAARLDIVCERRGERRPQFIRRAVLEALARAEESAISITPAQARRLAMLDQLEALQIDVESELDAILDRVGATPPALAAAGGS